MSSVLARISNIGAGRRMYPGTVHVCGAGVGGTGMYCDGFVHVGAACCAIGIIGMRYVGIAGCAAFGLQHVPQSVCAISVVCAPPVGRPPAPLFAPALTGHIPTSALSMHLAWVPELGGEVIKGPISGS